MNFTNNRTVSLKKMMAIAGLFWFFFLIFYLLGALTFHSGEQAFTAFYAWFNGSIFYPILATLLILTLAFHVFIAITRQLSNNVSSGERYKKPYPKAIPRIVAWSGASIILIFIITHTIQMLSINTIDLYSEVQNIFQRPIMWAIYGLGMIAISTHLHHGLTNVLQTLGISSKQHKGIALIIVLLIMAGYASIPLGVLYAKV
jgi:succinate dehydrogenase / fumarate reductase cytochrome b subunit|tara:strand:+ start:1809 stop:2414 length:606 start_codon:yes stop_codon:yes gene_type:complete